MSPAVATIFRYCSVMDLPPTYGVGELAKPGAITFTSST